MKERLYSIVNAIRRNKTIAAVCVAIVVMTAVSSAKVIAASNGAARYIGTAKAKSIALEHAEISEKEAVFVRVKLERDDGRYVYEVEFYSGNTEYDYEIDAISGDILEHDREIENYKIPAKNKKSNKSVKQAETGDYIGEAEAKEIALSKAGLSESQVRKIEVKLDREDGKMVYEVDFKSGRMEYEYEIDAISGEILKSDVEYDD